ncbi:DsbA family protein [uncultured Nostoc sp.]|uniref:DsbA family protein n=1 Tax=uncultured Nostoc sp. TaxID=340711 RepID=UPI0035CAAEC8
MYRLIQTVQQYFDLVFSQENQVCSLFSRLLQEISKRVHIDRINQDIESGYQSGVTVAPALFINRVRYTERWNIEQLKAAINHHYFLGWIF